MAPNKSALGGSLYLDEAVDPKLGVWGTLKESARITVEHKSILVVVVLVLLPLAAFTTSTTMWRLADVHDVGSAQQLCYEQVLGPAIAANLPPTSMPGYEKYCRAITEPTPAQTVDTIRKLYGGGWFFLEIAVTLLLASVAHAAIVRAAVQAYDVEERYGGVAEWLKLQFNRKLVQAAMRTLGTSLFANFVVYGALVFTLGLTYLVFVLLTPLGAAVAVCFLILVAASAGMLYLATSFFLAYTVSVVEAGTWGVRALSRSSKLITGHRRKSVVFMLPYALLFLPSASFITAAVATGLLKPSIGVAACIMALQIFFAYLSAAVPTVFYLKCRAYCSAVKNDVELGGQGYLPLERLVEKGDA